LRIDIAQKLTESEDQRVVWSHADAPEIFDELHLKGDLVAEVLVSPEGSGKCLVTGTLSGVQTLTCVRSLDLFDRPFETEIVVEVERGACAQQELHDDDDDVFAYTIPQTQDFVDVSECVRQLVTLQEPIAPVKNPDEDFIFVTNNQTGDGAEAEKPLDPRWEKLKALKSKMENRS
jgi:uncharacterized protein